ncbi:hypothetical protein BH10PLA2_BH10PLA2_27030 [soil metagenome]
MKHIDLNHHEEAIRQFFRTLPTDPEGSVVRLDGKVVAHVLPAESNEWTEIGSQEAWTAAKNSRRCQLIDKEIDSSLTAGEAHELKQLQKQMLRHVNSIAPYPVEGARHLHAELLAKAEAAFKK